MNTDLIWSKLLEKIKTEVNSIVYKTWFENSKLYELKDNIATILVPMEIHRKHLNESYLNLIIDNLFLITNQKYDINFILFNELKKVTATELEFDEMTTKLFIPKSLKILSGSVKKGGVYKIKLASLITKPDSNSTLASNWNNGIIPKFEVYVVEIIDKLGDGAYSIVYPCLFPYFMIICIMIIV